MTTETIKGVLKVAKQCHPDDYDKVSSEARYIPVGFAILENGFVMTSIESDKHNLLEYQNEYVEIDGIWNEDQDSFYVDNISIQE